MNLIAAPGLLAVQGPALCCAAALVLGGIGVAQTQHVFPVQALNAEGELAVDDYTGGVWWWSNPDQSPGALEFHSQVIYDLPGTAKGTITNIGFRRDGATLPGYALPQFKVDLEVRMSTSANTADSASSTFAANTGADMTVVIPRQTVVFGGQPFAGTFPEPFTYDVPLVVPFPFDGATGSLCIEVIHYGNDLMHPLRPTPLTVAVDAMAGSKRGTELLGGGRCDWGNEYLPPIELRTDFVIDDSSGSPRLQLSARRQYGQHHSRGFLYASMVRTSPGLPVVPMFSPPGGCGEITVGINQPLLFGIAESVSSSDLLGRIHWPDEPGSTTLIDVPWNPMYLGFQFYVQELSYSVHTQVYWASNWVLTQTPNYLPGGAPAEVRVLYAAGPGSHSTIQGTLGPMGIGPVTRFTMQ